jgi:hypothetical protein
MLWVQELYLNPCSFYGATGVAQDVPSIMHHPITPLGNVKVSKDPTNEPHGLHVNYCIIKDKLKPNKSKALIEVNPDTNVLMR